ncbi:FAD-dependent oxidoreductase [Chloroflexota bacterium]
MTGKSSFKKLMEPYHIGKLQVKNRLIKTGAGTSFIEEGGYIGETMKAFHEALARGGVGLIIVESCGVEFPRGVHHIPVHLHLDDDKYIPGYQELTEVMHQHGCPAFIQLFHSGPWHPKAVTGLQPIAASSLNENERAKLGLREELHELTIPEIKDLVDKFAAAAERASKAGFDGVEINANSSHLIDTFLSRAWNKRQDAYGAQNMENRTRFLVEILQETKKRLGQDFPVIVMITGTEYGIEDGITIEEAQGFARILQANGADAIQVRPFGYGSYEIIHPGPERFMYPEPPPTLLPGLDWSHHGAGAFVPEAEAIKKVVSIPVITVGRLGPELGEKAIKEGKTDFIGLHRRLLADPELPNKVAEGRLEDIAPCTACYYCWNERRNDRPVRCRINTALGREREYAIKPAGKKKRVVVVGGGPSGLETARVAALRGHEVILCEKEHKLGGLLPLAAMVKGFDIEDLAAVVRYLERQVTKLGVKVILGKEVTPAVIEALKPDVVILATGGTPVTLDIPGINRRNVVQSSDLHRRLKFFLRFLGPRVLRWLTRFWMPVGKNVVIIGGGIHGCQLAEFLIERNRKVTIVEMAGEIGEGVIPSDTKDRLLSWLERKGATMLTGVKYDEITDRGLFITTKEGERRTIAAYTVIPSLPMTANTELLSALEGKAPEVYQIGDCREPHLSAEAIADGARIAHAI